MHSISDNIESKIADETNEITEERLDSLLRKYQKDLEESIKASESTFDSAYLLQFKCHKIRLNRCGSYIDSPKQL